MAQSNIVPRIAQAIDELDIVDTHEHLYSFEKYYDTSRDVLQEYLQQYLLRDLLSAGLPKEDWDAAMDGSRPIEERFRLLAPYWDACRFTGYARALDIAAQDLYGIDGILLETIEALNDGFRRSAEAGDRYQRILKERSKIAISVVDQEWGQSDERFFRVAYNIGSLVAPPTLKYMRSTGEKHGIHVRTLSDWLEVCQREITLALSQQTVCLKCARAYNRTLHFPRTTTQQAEQDFIAAHRDHHLVGWGDPDTRIGEDFQNYVMHFILRLAEQKGIAIQFHTGLQEGSGNILANSHPLLLTNLFLDYPNLKFDLFHISYPFMGEAGALCKNFPNVFLDMCWAHIISPRASVDTLDEWLDAVPYNKISAFGGDYSLVDGVYGHQKMARRNVAATLSRKTLRGDMAEDDAIRIAQHLFVDNPMRILGIE